MADIFLDDVRGYWRDLAAPAFEEFWREYQSDGEFSGSRVILVYRRMIAAAFFLNHLADKAATLQGLTNPIQLINLIKIQDPDSANQMDACRHFVNDAKHEMKRIQEASLRSREANFDNEGAGKVLQFNMLSTDGKCLYDLCLTVCAVWRFWISYFDGSSEVNFRDAISQRAGANTSSPGSC
ncbi:hypothetical protein UIA24_19900 [Pseudomonas sp. AL 58]|uniref:hypothetical protein n=1 Tax=Pseudomonas sp. AL 58 TaxID=3104275 RepID=UPI002EC40C3C|nr:hypothetical protein [Pseudomonas sp. AL 58]